MSNASRRLVAFDKYKRVGPDYFGYYSSEVVNLLSQDEDALSVATQTPKLAQYKYGEGGKNLANHHDNFSGPLYSNGVGVGLSDFEKDRLRSLLRQSAISLSSEVDEVVDPVFATYHLQSELRSKTHSLNHLATTSNDVQVTCKKQKVVDPVFATYHLQSKLRSKTHSLNHLATTSNDVQVPCKKQKVSSPSTSARPSLLAQTSDVNPQCNRKVSDDLQFLLENASVDVEEMVKKYSDELSGTLGSMEQRLELLLDAAMSKCRSMTLGEKQQLQRSIQKLPAGNLDRVVEIICRSRPVEEQSCDEIFVDLEKENNATLWRLHYYVEAVEKARSLSCCEEA